MTDQQQDKLLEQARRLARHETPSRDLWSGIEAAIAEPPRRSVSPMFGQAAAVLLLVASSSAMTYWLTRDDAGTTIAVAPEYVFSEAAFGDNYTLGPAFSDARGGLVSKLATQLEKLPAEDRELIEDNLTMIRQAIDEINGELEKDPDNAQLQSLLLKTYREELTLMRRIGALTQSVTTRNDI